MPDAEPLEGPISWQTLPYEIQLSILRQVPLSKHKLSLHVTSKCWQRLLDDPAAHNSDLDWGEGYLVLAGAQATAARPWLSAVSSLRLVSPQQELEQAYILYSSERGDKLCLRDLPRSLTRLALSQYIEPDFDFLPSGVNTLCLRACTIREDSEESWGRIQQLDLQLHDLNGFLHSLQPALTFLRLDCTLPGCPAWEILRPLKPYLLPKLEVLEIVNVGRPRGDFAMFLWSFFDEIRACARLQLVSVSMYERTGELLSRRARFFKKIGQVLPPDCKLQVHELSDE